MKNTNNTSTTDAREGFYSGLLAFSIVMVVAIIEIAIFSLH
jgi:hypothetical protein